MRMMKMGMMMQRRNDYERSIERTQGIYTLITHNFSTQTSRNWIAIYSHAIPFVLK